MMRTGAHVTPETVSVWEDLVKTNSLDKPYRNVGWEYYEPMAEIMPVITRNQHVFQADKSMIGGTQDREFDGESQPWDIEDPTKELPSDDESPEEVESITQKPHLTASASAMSNIGTSMDRFTDAIIDVIRGTVSNTQPNTATTLPVEPLVVGTEHLSMTPQRRCYTAQWKIEDLDWLTGEEQLDMLDLFENSSTAVDMFLGFKSVDIWAVEAASLCKYSPVFQNLL
ncbi:hypothetical protein L218DRAFT_1002911 [Marasmius fiardii PR-910]|nr:hypothetical protein L218DRAFT_1002911 [Marasmius fiardii PR-910]